MIVLGIDGALGGFSAAVAGGGSIRAARSESGNVALEAGLSTVAAVLASADVSARQIERIAVGCGPGGFTGLRIAISYAKSLAQAWRTPLVAIDSFDLLEYGGALERVLTIVVGRPGVISARLRTGAAIARASGWIADVLDEIEAPLRRAQGGAGAAVLPVLGAPEDVLCALAERAIVVSPVTPSVASAACAAALAAVELTPAASVHAVRADYGELPAARVPRLK